MWDTLLEAMNGLNYITGCRFKDRGVGPTESREKDSTEKGSTGSTGQLLGAVIDVGLMSSMGWGVRVGIRMLSSMKGVGIRS